MMIPVNVTMQLHQLRNLINILGGVARLQAGLHDEEVVMHDLKEACDAETVIKLWDMFIKVQVDAALHTESKTEPEEPITVVIHKRKN